MKKLTIQECLSNFKNIHGDRYDYSQFIYNNSHTKSTVICRIHGHFEITPSMHRGGQGCKQCGLEKVIKESISNIKDFSDKAKVIHSNLYSYENSFYKGSKIKLKITCPTHGDFKQTPNAHLRGNGCKICALRTGRGYTKSDFIQKAKGRECTFYILKCFNKNEEFYKIGITSTSISIRYNDKKKMPYNYEIISEIKSFDAGYIWDLEIKNKKLLTSYHYNPNCNFKGYTECFSNVNMLLNSIENKNI